MHKVIYPFKDLKDDKKTTYKIGDSYPRKGFKVAKARLDELSGNKNKILREKSHIFK